MSTILNLNMSFNPRKARQLSVSTLAFVGDAVYGLLVRTMLADTDRPSGQLHTASVEFVKASAQAKAFGCIESKLTEEETAVFKRGRNFHTKNTPKNASGMDYHIATGLESLFGFLYLSGQANRIDELFNKIRQEILATL